MIPHITLAAALSNSMYGDECSQRVYIILRPMGELPAAESVSPPFPCSEP